MEVERVEVFHFFKNENLIQKQKQGTSKISKMRNVVL